MTGDSHSNDDADFLVEDFVIEDVVGKNDDLEDLFDEPTHPRSDSVAAAASDDATAEPDADDLLFSDHSEGIQPSEEFHKPVFAEDASSEWSGEELDLESVGVPDATIEGEELAADPQFLEAEESFAAELDSLLSSDEDFATSSEDDELELVDFEPSLGDGISEFEQSGPFILDDGDGLWAEELEEQDDEQGLPSELEVDEFELVSVDGEQLEVDEAYEDTAEAKEHGGFSVLSASDQMVHNAFGASRDAEDLPELEPYDQDADDQEVGSMPLLHAARTAGEAGWEPLPTTSVDSLSEVHEVQRTDDEEYDVSGYEDDEAVEGNDGEVFEGEEGYEEYAGAASEVDLEDVDGHDLYAEDSGRPRGAVLGGPGPRRRRVGGVLLSIAATFLILFGAATAIVRPEWFGLSVEPEQVAKVDVSRPKIEVAVLEPPAVKLVTEPTLEPTNSPVLANGASQTQPETVETQPGAAETAQAVGVNEPVAAGTETQPQPSNQAPSQPTEVLATGNADPVTPPIAQLPSEQTQPAEVGVATQQSPVASTEPVTGGDATAGTMQPGVGAENSWPIASADPNEAGATSPVASNKEELIRFGSGLMVGEAVDDAAGQVRAIEGVMPGSRAFAQLHNGNYFIGQVKHVADESITLRVETGEVTLATIEIAQFIEYWHHDYYHRPNPPPLLRWRLRVHRLRLAL